MLPRLKLQSCNEAIISFKHWNWDAALNLQWCRAPTRDRIRVDGACLGWACLGFSLTSPHRDPRPY